MKHLLAILMTLAPVMALAADGKPKGLLNP